MILDTIVVGALQVNCYVLGCPRTHEAAIIDPGDNAPAILAALEQYRLHAIYILATHGHFDHIMAAAPLRAATGAQFMVHPADAPIVANLRQAAQGWIGSDPGDPPAVDGELAAGQVLRFGDESLEVRATPGHSPGGVTFVDHTHRYVFTGDALFAGSVGRTDLPGGSGRTLIESIRSQIISLPGDYEILPGHGPNSTVGEEIRSNPFLDPSAFDFWF